MLKFDQIRIFASERLYHAYALNIFIVGTRDLAIRASALTELHQNQALEFHRHKDHDRDDGRNDQCQPPVDDRHEGQRRDDVHECPNTIHDAPSDEFRHSSRIGGDARDQSPDCILGIVKDAGF